jgi:dipeptidyl aminopeptidase/acylaminoacyl peptidase
MLLKKRHASATIALCLTALTPAIAAHKITIDDILALQDVTQPRISPTGDAVLYQVETPDLTADDTDTHIWLTSWDASKTIQLTSRAKESETDPRWRPDGQAISFLSDRAGTDGESQLWLMNRAGGEAQKLTDLRGGIEDYAWAPDGSHIALIVKDPSPAQKSGDDAPPKPIVIDRFQFKQDIEGYLTARRHHLYLFDTATRHATQLIAGPYDEALPAFSPDSRQIAFVSKRQPNAERDGHWAIYVIDTKPGAVPRALTNYDGSDDDPDWLSPPAWSPDGTKIAYVHGGPKKLIEYGVRSLAVVPASGGPPRVLTPALDRNVTAPAWSPDGKQIRFLVEDDRADYLASIDPNGGEPKTLAGGRRVVIGFSEAPGDHIALLAGKPTVPDEIYAWEQGTERPLSKRNAAWLSQVQLATVRDIAFPSADGTDVHGFLLSPPDYVTGKRYPTILALHGGPQDQLDYRFDFDLDYYLSLQLLADHGYVVLAVNPRGSTGRGQAFAAGIYADWGDKDAQDVLAAVDYAVRQGIADPQHLGIGGWSYGGMLTNYVIAQDHRFRAATSGASSSNILATWGTDEYVHDYEAELGTPWAHTAIWEKISFPFLHADRITTPTLFMGGDKDDNVPLLNQEQMYQALRSLNVETQLIIYPGSFHIQTRPSYIRDRSRRDLAWFDTHVLAPTKN